MAACLGMMIIAVAAQYSDGGGYDDNMPKDMPGMHMGPTPMSNLGSSLVYPSMLLGALLGFMVTVVVNN